MVAQGLSAYARETVKDIRFYSRFWMIGIKPLFTVNFACFLGFCDVLSPIAS